MVYFDELNFDVLDFQLRVVSYKLRRSRGGLSPD